MTTWRRRLALRIDPTLQHPLDVARSTAVTLLNERRFQRLAETHANTLRTAAGMLEDPTRPGETFLCGWELYAKLGQDVVRCKGCGTQHSVALRREQMLARLGDQLVTAADAARALSTPDREVTAAMVRGWKHRGGLTPATRVDDAGGTIPLCDDRGRPLYRLRDVQTAHNHIRYGTVTTSAGRAS